MKKPTGTAFPALSGSVGSGRKFWPGRRSRIYTDHSLTGTNRSHPRLDQALAASGPDKQQKELKRMRETGDYSIGDLAEMFSVSRPTVYLTLARQNCAK